ncbi:MAG: glycoside hydrolase family 5 protein [Treponema sp.]|nr:glycoside hydrolase family 5 protein [Treponema sp.]
MKHLKIQLFLLGFFLFLVSCAEEPTAANGPAGGGENLDSGDPQTRIETAAELVRDMGLGVNIGNSFDSVYTEGVAGETGWGNPRVTQAYIKALKAHGFKTIRLPVTWADYIGQAPAYTLTKSWIDRVEQVVNWILAEDMYCILNMHHDGSPNIGEKSWIETACLGGEKEAEVKARFAAVWRQIALRFYFTENSEKLVFEGMNEPQFDALWPRGSGDQASKEKAFGLLNMLNQTFTDTVRANSAGSKYEQYRYLLVSGYWTDIDMTMDSLFKMPADSIQDRLILSLHYYTPWDFCGGNSSSWTNAAQLETQFGKMKTAFLDRGIPVILGEYGVNINNNGGDVNSTAKNPDHRMNWMLAVTQKCIDLGVCSVLWDTGMRNNNKGMADLQRNGAFAISDNLKEVIERVEWPVVPGEKK